MNFFKVVASLVIGGAVVTASAFALINKCSRKSHDGSDNVSEDEDCSENILEQQGEDEVEIMDQVTNNFDKVEEFIVNAKELSTRVSKFIDSLLFFLIKARQFFDMCMQDTRSMNISCP